MFVRVYIPFNSNDFNSVFTTLSISPRSFYATRKYSFRRATATLLNKSDDYLIAYEKPIFHNKERDNENGLPVLIEINIEESEYKIQTNFDEVKYIVFESTLFLFNEFRLIFRTKQELDEVFARSLMSLEAKYINLAKERSTIISADQYAVEDLPKLKLPLINRHYNPITFRRERVLNRLFGVVLGCAIGHSSSISNEWREISILLRKLNNILSLYINKVGDDNAYEKTRALDVIDQIIKVHGIIENQDETILLGSTFTMDVFHSLKQSTVFNVRAFDLLIEGLLAVGSSDLPLSLQLNKLKRAINSRFHSNFPSNYVEKINTAFSDVKAKIENETSSSRSENQITPDVLAKPLFENHRMGLQLPGYFTPIDHAYLVECLCFFIQKEDIADVEALFINRKAILIHLAKHFKAHIEDFDSSKEREYLLELLNSFDNIRGRFHIDGSSSEVLKTLGILFTSGRDILKFIENCEREGIQNPSIYFMIWAGVYGASAIPKTLTEQITKDKASIRALTDAFSDTATAFGRASIIKSDEDTIENKANSEKSAPKLAEERTEPYQKLISESGNLVLSQVVAKRKVKVSELMKLSKVFKRQSDIEELVRKELIDRVRLLKEGRTMYAEKIEANELLSIFAEKR